MIHTRKSFRRIPTALFVLCTIPSSLCFTNAPLPIQLSLCGTRPYAISQWQAASTSNDVDLEDLASSLNKALDAAKKELIRTCNVRVGPSGVDRLGLIATTDIKKGDLLLNMPHDERWELTAATARNVVFKDVLDKDYDGWTGETGLVALQLLNEVARASGSGLEQPTRPVPIQEFMNAWIHALPTSMDHPLLWSESDQEVLQSSSNTKIYRVLDDIEEDATWLVEKIFDKDRTKFPETINLNGEDLPCFSLDGYRWAMAIVQSRSIFVDGSLRLVPLMDMCNHDDTAKEIQGGTMGAFGTTKGCELTATRPYKAGEEVFCSYGPKSAADYLLEHGFCPPQSWKTAVSEITLEIDPDDRFYDDKLDILEFETYDQAPMDPLQSFDVISAPGRDGEPDPAMIQFARLRQLGGLDAFMLESLFRKEVWGFMALPVSETNELAVVNAISEACESALEELNQCPDGGREVCTKLRESEKKALKRTLEFMLREKEALDLKEYYQERRLKDLGLDSEWSPEDDITDPDLSYGQTRAPGGADYDW
ncbi:SET methyltransferase domain containing protein [Nitzschia inconspicua]|uniref:SET methyltransferase domain containing protein n=1 Tax=Nitzschia inconspicua TaxID=303405 RepID=A0A9K3LZ03_9STRA|nr:SET methyltransferase domain containing protein [Nitzschia inconspicua]